MLVQIGLVSPIRIPPDDANPDYTHNLTAFLYTLTVDLTL